MNTRAFIVPLLAAAVLAACATASTDPREGGLLGGISGLSSGAYDARVREREDRLAALRETQQGLQQERGALETRQREQHSLVSAERARLAALNADVARLDAEAKALASRHGGQDRRVAELQQRLGSLQRDMRAQQSALDALEGSTLGDTDQDLRRRQLEEQRDALRREFDLLMQLSLELAR